MVAYVDERIFSVELIGAVRLLLLFFSGQSLSVSATGSATRIVCTEDASTKLDRTPFF